MEREEYKRHYELEERFWWFAGRRKVILNVLDSLPLKKGNSKILDAGCGTGYNLKIFQGYGNSSGCDISEQAISFCQKRGLKSIIQADVQKMPFKNSSFDLVTLLDVLDHQSIKSDLDVLLEVQRILRKGGYFLLTSPAFNFLYSRHDLAFHTRERYTRKSLKEKLEKANFSVLRMSYFNLFLFFPLAVVRSLKKIWQKVDRPESELRPLPQRMNAILLGILKLESLLIKRIDLPLGSSVLCLAKKKSL